MGILNYIVYSLILSVEIVFHIFNVAIKFQSIFLTGNDLLVNFSNGEGVYLVCGTGVSNNGHIFGVREVLVCTQTRYLRLISKFIAVELRNDKREIHSGTE